MSIAPTATPEQVRTLIKDYLESFEELSPVEFLKGQPKQIGAKIDEALAKLGLCAVLVPAKVNTRGANQQWALGNRTLYVIRVFENPELDESPMTGFDAAYFIAQACNGVCLDEENQLKMECDEDSVTIGDDVGNEDQPCVSWDVPLWVHVRATATWAQVATPVITYNLAGQVQMTCATPGAQIFYTTNGSKPNARSSVYTGILSGVENASQIQAKAYLINLITSEVATAQLGEIEDTTVTLAQINAALAAVNSPMRYHSTTGVPLIQGTDGKWTPILVTVGPAPDNDRNLVASQAATEELP